jgi:hypothetical protein
MNEIGIGDLLLFDASVCMKNGNLLFDAAKVGANDNYFFRLSNACCLLSVHLNDSVSFNISVSGTAV